MKLKHFLLALAVAAPLLCVEAFFLGKAARGRIYAEALADLTAQLPAADTVVVRDTVAVAGPQMVKTVVKIVRDTVEVKTVEQIPVYLPLTRETYEYTGEHFAAWVSGSVLDGRPDTAPALDSIAVYPETKIVERPVPVAAPAAPVRPLAVSAEAFALTTRSASGMIGAGIRGTYARGIVTASALAGYGWEVQPGVAPASGGLVAGASLGLQLFRF